MEGVAGFCEAPLVDTSNESEMRTPVAVSISMLQGRRSLATTLSDFEMGFRLTALLKRDPGAELDVSFGPSSLLGSRACIIVALVAV